MKNSSIFPIIETEAELQGILDINGENVKIGDYIKVYEYVNKSYFDEKTNRIVMTGEKGDLLYVYNAYVEMIDGCICYRSINYETVSARPELNDTFTDGFYENISNLKFYKNVDPIREFEIIKYF